jgi:hypothetical protein
MRAVPLGSTRYMSRRHFCLVAATVLTRAAVGQQLYPQTPAESSAGITPTNRDYPPGNVLRYGTNTTPGITDMTAAFNSALACNSRVHVPGGTYLISTILHLTSNQTFSGDGPLSQLNFSSTASVDNIIGNNVSDTTVSDLKINVTGVVTANHYQGVVAFRGSNNCRAQRLEIVGFYADGILLNACQNCQVDDCYLHDVQGSLGSQSDIHVNSTAARSSSGNIIANNRCYGGGAFGVSCFQNLSDGLPVTGNRVTGNRVGQHDGYGILLYDKVATGVDCWNEVSANYVENIQGVGNPDFGAGIYVANQGGCSITGNTIRNCCVRTATANLTPGGIGINVQSQHSPFTVTGNSIYDMAQGNTGKIPIAGIYVVNATRGGTIANNTISQQVAGGLQNGIFVPGASSLTITANAINILPTLADTRGIFVYARGASISDLTISGNTIDGCSVVGLEIASIGVHTITNVAVDGNILADSGSAATGILVQAVVQGVISNNTVTAAQQVALSVSACRETRIVGNRFDSTGRTTISFGGDCTGSVIDGSNFISGGPGGISNHATGLRVATASTSG